MFHVLHREEIAEILTQIKSFLGLFYCCCFHVKWPNQQFPLLFRDHSVTRYIFLT